MLYLIGLGLWDEKDISLRGLEIAKRADEVYLDSYTSMMGGTELKNMEALIGKHITPLDRDKLEQHTGWLDGGREKDIALLVGGDPLVATTHSDLMMRAWDKGVKTRVVHNASIFSAVAESGLQIYKFGKTATVTYWEENYRPTSFYDVVRENKERGLHTLLLLDIRPGKQMSPKEAIGIMEEIDSSFGDEKIIVMSRVGGDIGIAYGKAKKLEGLDYGGGLHVLIVPGRMHVMETAFLQHFRKD